MLQATSLTWAMVPSCITPRWDTEQLDGGILDSNLDQPWGLSFWGFFCNSPETVCDFAVPFCLMLISVIFVVYYSYTLCLQMLSFLVLKIWENGQHPLAEHLPRSGTDGGSPSHRTRAGGKGRDLPSEHETNKKPPSSCSGVVWQKNWRWGNLKLCHIYSPQLLALPWVHNMPTARDHFLQPLLHVSTVWEAQDALWAAL